MVHSSPDLHAQAPPSVQASDDVGPASGTVPFEPELPALPELELELEELELEPVVSSSLHPATTSTPAVKATAKAR